LRFNISHIFAGGFHLGIGCGAVARYHTHETPFGTLSYWAPDNFVPRKECDLSTGTVEKFLRRKIACGYGYGMLEGIPD